MTQANEKLFDIRIRDLNVKRGRIMKKDIDDYLKSLPDDTESGEQIVVFDEEEEESEEEAPNT